ncbi:hypothetical protein ACHFCA_27515 [Delftia tsuruhatensis]
MPDREDGGSGGRSDLGAKGQNCTMLPLNDVEGAAARGDLVLLD